MTRYLELSAQVTLMPVVEAPGWTQHELSPVQGKAIFPVEKIMTPTDLQNLRHAVQKKSRRKVTTPADLTGGYILMDADRIIFRLMCCTDFGNLRDWEQAAQYRGSPWQMHWMGHPWSWVRFVEGKLHFAEPSETQTFIKTSVIYRVEPKHLAQVVQTARTIYQAFEQRFIQATAP